MRVAHICTKFSRLSETFVYDLILGLEKSGIENHVLTAVRLNAVERPFKRVSVIPLPVLDVAAFLIKKNIFGKYELEFPEKPALEKLESIKPSVMVAHFGSAGLAIAPAARKAGIPLVVVFHAFDLFTKQFEPETYAGLRGIIDMAVAISEHGKKRLKDLGFSEERISIIHCGIDTERFKPKAEGSGSGKIIKLISVGRLVEKKGFDTLIEAISIFCKKKGAESNISLDIWGEGPLEKTLEKQIERLGMIDTVSLKGSVPSAEMPKLLSRYDIFVQPSKTAKNGDIEGIPITLLEAQAKGLPVIATRHGGIPEGVPPDNHFLLVDESDPKEMAEKIEFLAERRESWRAIGKTGRNWVEKHFTLDGEVEAFSELFEKLADRREAAKIAKRDERGL